LASLRSPGPDSYKGINTTFIALIPNVDSPQRLNDFRSISLVGSLYKILIGYVILESQSAFVKNRQILYGILIPNEIVDEDRKLKKDLLLFKWILKRHMILLIGASWILCWVECLFRFSGKSGFVSVLVQLQLQCLLMVVRQMSFH